MIFLPFLEPPFTFVDGIKLRMCIKHIHLLLLWCENSVNRGKKKKNRLYIFFFCKKMITVEFHAEKNTRLNRTQLEAKRVVLSTVFNE